MYKIDKKWIFWITFVPICRIFILQIQNEYFICKINYSLFVIRIPSSMAHCCVCIRCYGCKKKFCFLLLCYCIFCYVNSMPKWPIHTVDLRKCAKKWQLLNFRNESRKMKRHLGNNIHLLCFCIKQWIHPYNLYHFISSIWSLDFNHIETR